MPSSPSSNRSSPRARTAPTSLRGSWLEAPSYQANQADLALPVAAVHHRDRAVTGHGELAREQTLQAAVGAEVGIGGAGDDRVPPERAPTVLGAREAEPEGAVSGGAQPLPKDREVVVAVDG